MFLIYLGNWLRSFRIQIIKKFKRWPIFDAVVTDFSYAEIFAILDVFNGIDIVQYLNKTFEFVEQKKIEEFSNEHTKIYLCCSHLSHNIAKDINIYFEKFSEARNLIREIIASFFIISRIDTIENIWSKLCIILYSKVVTETTKCALEEIVDIIASYKTANINEFENYDRNENKSEWSENDEYVTDVKRKLNDTLYLQSPYYKLFKRIADDATINTEIRDGPTNAFFCPEMVTIILKKYMTFLPFWSGIMKTSDKRFSNSHIENYWKILKERFRESKSIGKLPAKPLRILKSIDERTKNLYTRYINEIPKKSQKNAAVKNDSSEITLGELQQISESWSKAKPTTIRNAFSLSKLKTLSEIKNKNGTNELLHSLVEKKIVKEKSIQHHIQSGSYMLLKAGAKNAESNFKYIYTCAFDAFSQCILAACENASFMKEVDTNNDLFFRMIKCMRSRDNKMAETNKYMILEKLFGLEKRCDTTVARMSQLFLSIIPSIKFIFKCSSCGSIKTENNDTLPIELNLFEKLGVKGLQTCFIDEIMPPTCKLCCMVINYTN